MLPENPPPSGHKTINVSLAAATPSFPLQPAPIHGQVAGLLGDGPPNVQTQISPDQKLLLYQGQESVCHPTATANFLNSLLAAFH